MSRLETKQRWLLVFGGFLLTILLSAVFTFGSLDVPFEPKNWRDALTLYAVSSFITAALLVFGLILMRTMLRLWAERSKDQLGARFKSKMVLGAMAISLLPIVFMFFVSYSLLNRTLGRWFPRPLEIASEQTQIMFNDFGRGQIPRLKLLANQAQVRSTASPEKFFTSAIELGADAAWILDHDGKVLAGKTSCPNPTSAQLGATAPSNSSTTPTDHTAVLCLLNNTHAALIRTLPSGIELWQSDHQTFFAARVLATEKIAPGGSVVVGFRTNPNFLDRYNLIQKQTAEYNSQKQNLRALKRQMLLILLFFTVLLLFSVTWVALFLAKQVTVPIQALAEGTREISGGNFEYQVAEQTHDELGLLIRSFNTMTTQLRDNRSQIDQFTRNLQQAVQELERRRQLMETVLENVPTGVISLDAQAAVLRCNTAVSHMFGIIPQNLQSVEELLGPEAYRTIQYLMRRSLRTGVVSREIETVVAGRVIHLAVTVSSLGPRRANAGFVIVLDDLTEMLRAQKLAAWQEVARRIAHEIKNPLTPIQLSSQRLSRFLERRDTREKDSPLDPELSTLAMECSRLIEREVSTLAALVNEFSQFVRFPTAKLIAADANSVVHGAVEVFSGRLDGITLKTLLADELPAIRADEGLLRSVIVNLIDNAAESLENSPLKEILVATHHHPESETVEISVADTGHGISPEDKDKLFLPHFSTKDRGTGLGLAIAARIIAEHAGTIRVQDHHPIGSRFVVELPVHAEVPAISDPISHS